MPDVPDPAFGPIRTVFSDRESGYNALVLTAVKRMTHHVQFQSSYAWSHTLSNGEDFFGLSEPGNPLAPLRLDNASAQNDLRNLVNFNFVADTDNLLHTPVLRTILNNWTFGMMSTLQAGRPFPVSTGDASFAGLNFTELGSRNHAKTERLHGGIVGTRLRRGTDRRSGSHEHRLNFGHEPGSGAQWCRHLCCSRA